MSSDILKNAEKFAYEFYRENETDQIVYHDIVHTIDVVNSVEEIAVGNNLSEEEQEIILLSAWFHDLGYLNSREEHERESCQIAETFLLKHNYPSEKIEKVKSCIMVTKPPQSPANKLEEVICDADMLHLAKKNFAERSELLKAEIEINEDRTIDPKEWYEQTSKVITEHEYFTSYAKDNYSKTKRNNFAKLKKRFSEAHLKTETNKLKQEKLILEKQKLKDKKKSSNKADRGIETMFRNVMRTHVEFSGLADNKANIMISVNTLLLTAIVAILARKLDSNPHLIIPTIILTIVSLGTLAFATVVTRPKITDGVFTTDDIKKKRTNLLFFGNFYKMKLEEFSWGMQEMMNDREFLYGSMIMDFYYLGQVLGRKYRYLNICYSIFLYGMIISVIAFGIAVFVYGDGSEFGNIID